MDYLLLIGSGIIIGIVVAAPIGPVNLICIRRTLAYGPLNGFFSGLGAALGDGVFAVVTAFGLTAIAQLIRGYAAGLEIAGGLMLIAFGIHTFLADPSHGRDDSGLPTRIEGSTSLGRAIASTFALTITNPATFFGFAALFAGLGSLAGEETSYIDAAIVVAGVVGGSVLWWFAVTAITGLFHAKIDTNVMRHINQVSGVAVSGFGLAILGHLVATRLL